MPRGRQLLVRYRDNGPEARIRVELRQVSLATGAGTTWGTFDSDAFSQSSSYQVAGLTSTTCSLGGGFDFINNLYFLNVTVDKTGVNGNPGLWMIQVCSLC